MAESAVKFKIFADAAAAERAIVQLERKFGTLEQQVKRTGKASKDSANEVIQEMTALASRVTLVSSVVAAGSMVWSRYHAEIAKVAKAEADLRRESVRSLTTSGGLKGGERAAFGRSLLDQGILPGQAIAALRGAEAGAPLMNVERQKAIASEFALLAPALAPLDEAGKVSDTSQLESATNVGAMLGEAFSKKSAGDIADLTMALRRSVGSSDVAALASGKFEVALATLQQRGFSDERALAMLATGVEAGFSPKELLKRDVFRRLDQERVTDLEGKFAGAVTGDLARQIARETTVADPLGALGQKAGVAALETLEGAASVSERLDAMQQLRYNQSRGFWAKAGRLFQEGVEELGLGGAQVTPGALGGEAILKSIESHLQKQTEIMLGEHQNRPMNINAHTE